MTTYSKLIEMGHTDEQIRAAKEDLNPRMFSVSVVDTPDGVPIVGIAYQCDYRYEEEAGVGEMAKLFNGAKNQRDYVHLTPDGFVVFGTDLPSHRTIPSARGYWYGHVSYAQDFESMKTYRMSVKEMRAWAKENDLKLTGKTKRAEIERAVEDHWQSRAKAAKPNRFPGYFHNGLPLILKASGSSVVRDVLALMVAAAQDNELGVSGGGGPFSTGFGFYNKQDVGPKLKAEIAEQQRFVKEHMDALEPVKAELEAKGYGFYALGRPTEMEDGVKYWLNGETKKIGKQPFGWYTLEELRAEKFVADILNRN